MLSSAVLLAASMVVGQAAEPNIPSDVIESLGYYVGEWKSERTENGRIHASQFTAEWMPGKYCTILRGKVQSPDGDRQFTLLSGWDVLTKEVVDYSYGSDGSQSMERWKIVSPTVEESTSTGVSVDGKPTSATYRIEKKGSDLFIQTITNRKEGDESKPDVVLEYKKAKNPEVPAKKKRNRRN